MTTYCGRCGQLDDDRSHDDCARFLVLEPPRYCSSCARRMKVQVSPMGWVATCVEHGARTANDSAQDSTTAP